MTSYLVMLQTNSNQPFIFSSPRLREQIGASFEITGSSELSVGDRVLVGGCG